MSISNQMLLSSKLCFSESFLKMAVCNGRHLFICHFDYERAISPGLTVSAPIPLLQQVCTLWRAAIKEPLARAGFLWECQTETVCVCGVCVCVRVVRESVMYYFIFVDVSIVSVCVCQPYLYVCVCDMFSEMSHKSKQGQEWLGGGGLSSFAPALAHSAFLCLDLQCGHHACWPTVQSLHTHTHIYFTLFSKCIRTLKRKLNIWIYAPEFQYRI